MTDEAFVISTSEKAAEPAPVNLGQRSVAWIDAEIARWIDDRVTSTRNRASKAEVR